MLTRPLPEPARDIVLLVTRVLIGVVLLAHGLQKLSDFSGTVAGFGKGGVPLPPVSAVYAILVEVPGAVLLILGALTPLLGLLILLDMLGAAVFVHLPHGIFVEKGGWELVGMIAAGAVALAAAGAGRFSIDHALNTRRSTAPTAA